MRLGWLTVVVRALIVPRLSFWCGRYRRQGEAEVDPLSFDNVGWFYKDLEGAVFGPFRSAQMRSWLKQGYFHLGLLVCLGPPGDSDSSTSRKFLPLKEWFPATLADAFPDSARQVLAPLRKLLRREDHGEAPQQLLPPNLKLAVDTTRRGDTETKRSFASPRTSPALGQLGLVTSPTF